MSSRLTVAALAALLVAQTSCSFLKTRPPPEDKQARPTCSPRPNAPVADTVIAALAAGAIAAAVLLPQDLPVTTYPELPGGRIIPIIGFSAALAGFGSSAAYGWVRTGQCAEATEAWNAAHPEVLAAEKAAEDARRAAARQSAEERRRAALAAKEEKRNAKLRSRELKAAMREQERAELAPYMKAGPIHLATSATREQAFGALLRSFVEAGLPIEVNDAVGGVVQTTRLYKPDWSWQHEVRLAGMVENGYVTLLPRVEWCPNRCVEQSEYSEDTARFLRNLVMAIGSRLPAPVPAAAPPQPLPVAPPPPPAP